MNDGLFYLFQRELYKRGGETILINGDISKAIIPVCVGISLLIFTAPLYVSEDIPVQGFLCRYWSLMTFLVFIKSKRGFFDKTH